MSPSNTEATIWLDHETGLAPLAAWCEAHPGSRCHLWLGGGLTVPLVVDPAVPLRDETALRAYAGRVFQHYGLPETAALATWQSGRWRGAVGLEGLDWARVQDLARRHRVKILSARPAWVQALPLLPRPAGTVQLLVVEPAVSTLLTLHDGALVDVQPHWVAAEAAPSVAAGAQRVSVDPAAARRIGAPVPDFTQSPLRHEAWPGWALATTGAMVMAVTLGTRTPSTPEVEAVAEAAPTQAAWAGARLHDWGRVWQAAESASDERLRWLSFQHDGRSGEVRLVGRAPDVETALAAADRLGRAPGVAQALLARSETDAAGVRFELLARMGGGVPR